jgi:hypothetical protein
MFTAQRVVLLLSWLLAIIKRNIFEVEMENYSSLVNSRDTEEGKYDTH